MEKPPPAKPKPNKTHYQNTPDIQMHHFSITKQALSRHWRKESLYSVEALLRAEKLPTALTAN
jgi:hypothetical protein